MNRVGQGTHSRAQPCGGAEDRFAAGFWPAEELYNSRLA